MDIDLNSNGNSKQVGNLTVFIGSDPFLPQPDSPTVELDIVTVDESSYTHQHLQLLWITHQKISPNPPSFILRSRYLLRY